jgi:hypothetical protein
VRRAFALVALALAAVPCAAGAAPPRRSFVLPEAAVGRPALVGDALYYVVRTSRLETVKRVDLNTLQVAAVYSKPARSWGLGPVRAGGGRVAIELDDVNPRGGLASEVVELDPAGAPPRMVARGRLRVARRRTCGTEVALEDVSPEGELLVDEGRMGCPPGSTEHHALRSHGAGPPAVIHRYAEKLSDETRQWRLVGGRLLEATERAARVGGRRIAASGRGFQLEWADLDAAADVVTGEIRVRGRSVHQLVRLLTPAGGRVLFDARDVQAEPRFCGGRLVVQAVTRQSQQLMVYDDLAGPPRMPFGVPRQSNDLEIQLACNADTAVLVDQQAPRRTAIEVVPLAP